MKLTYIFHSSFALETEQCLLFFDYWMDPAHVAERMLHTSKPVYVFASHFHSDHFDRRILQWRSEYPQTSITYILSKDILKHHKAQSTDADVWMVKGSHWQDERLQVWAAGSTDSGVSWVVNVDGKCIFHAGDLNNWYARFLTDDYDGGNIWSREFGSINPGREEKMYLGELKDLQKIAKHFDVVMFPVDGRIGNGYTRGGRQFLKHFSVELFVPMHFVMSGFESAWRIGEYTPATNTQLWCIKHEGECIDIC